MRDPHAEQVGSDGQSELSAVLLAEMVERFESRTVSFESGGRDREPYQVSRLPHQVWMGGGEGMVGEREC